MKDQVRREDVAMLQQGVTLPNPAMGAEVALPPVRGLQPLPTREPENPAPMNDPEDRTGLARVRVRQPAVTAPVPPAVASPSGGRPST